MKIIIRDAKSEDLDWLRELMTQGMRDGHYLTQSSDTTRAMLQQIIERGVMFRRTNKNPMQHGGGGLITEGIQAWIDVLEMGGEKAGFSLSAQWKAESEDREILCISTAKNYRKQGVASLLIDYVIARHDSDTKFYARCYPKSSHAYDLFLSHSFQHESTQPLGTRVLFYCATKKDYDCRKVRVLQALR